MRSWVLIMHIMAAFHFYLVNYFKEMVLFSLFWCLRLSCLPGLMLSSLPERRSSFAASAVAAGASRRQTPVYEAAWRLCQRSERAFSLVRFIGRERWDSCWVKLLG